MTLRQAIPVASALAAVAIAALAVTGVIGLGLAGILVVGLSAYAWATRLVASPRWLPSLVVDPLLLPPDIVVLQDSSGALDGLPDCSVLQQRLQVSGLIVWGWVIVAPIAIGFSRLRAQKNLAASHDLQTRTRAG